MNATDVALLLIGSYFLIRGLFRGITGEILMLVGVIGGFYCAIRFYPPIAGFLADTFGVTQLFTTALSMVLIFFSIFAACALVDRALKKILKETKLTWVDKFLGGVAGLLKLYIVTLLLLVSGMFLSPITGDEWVRESKTLILTARTWPVVYPLLDRIGVLPDLQKLQGEAKAYIMRQAMESIFGPPDDRAPDDTAAASDDARTDSAPADGALEEAERQNPMLEFFLNLRKRGAAPPESGRDDRDIPITEQEAAPQDA